MLSRIKKLGPGLLFAGAAIGVSHLVQSTRAGADFGFGLVWALLLVNLFKYPFFRYGPQYAMATGESLIDGYYRLGKVFLALYFLLTFATMFTIQTAVTIVTASLTSYVIYEFETVSFVGYTLTSVQIWTLIILLICIAILVLGRYKFLDRLMKLIVLTLTLSTILSVFASGFNSENPLSIRQIFPEQSQWLFLIAFMGWMPAPLDISIWHSVWSLEKKKDDNLVDFKSSIFDFNIGYITTILLGLGFLTLGALVFYGSGEVLQTSAAGFSSQLIIMYTNSLGDWAYAIIGIAAVTTMFSTTLTTFDASPRVMSRTTALLSNFKFKETYRLWLGVLFAGTLSIFFFLSANLGDLVQIATVLSFLTAPFYAIANYKLINAEHVPKAYRPKRIINILSWLGIVFLVGFSVWFVTIL
ncbi:Mn2+/Fe2+ NRAMP family transporter [Winogradskyella wandonensis]|uniref:Mn2+/Fe2+ NRAMP family transporter n=1 Tax=Winogradskyella wandonensis TaxID=1442586 RepID=A0A4R1KQJ2_9FLAO|nr:divalent metal cation transporter [Winogradskyella wandonensis]TCK67304.1 Mn2+/Fe2+ NRAMP family transporter [Winogradskyella wandonensis]